MNDTHTVFRLFDSEAASSCPTVAEILDWFEAQEIQGAFNPDALIERRRQWKMFRAAYGDRTLPCCRPVDLLNFINGQRKARSNWTRRRIKSTICKPFKVAAELGLIDRNPFAGLRFKEGKCGRDWTQEEYQAVLRASLPYFRRLVVFLRFAGARPGEGRTLIWPDIREEMETIVQDEHKTAYLQKGPRRIHFNDVLLKLLIWLRRNKAHPRHVFVNKCGRPWTLRGLTNNVWLLRQRIGLPDDVKLHGARHTFATQALLNGVDIATLAELLGHRDLRTTQRYVHLLDKRGHLNAAMNKAVGRSKKG